MIDIIDAVLLIVLLLILVIQARNSKKIDRLIVEMKKQNMIVKEAEEDLDKLNEITET